ncbi:oligoendopeptidase F [Lacticaseibacillus chiayiensis]|uniref:oligoendopeptidase F n=1 Tax=Lacticaseibacillus chiayiensis TaxID=2100821 RepID=UPI001BCF1918|nr:oligoendopeptidase F [Lacticaseibacillus chiayiensis]QVI35319.1 oligoendopeptidase F [Lacticaseibacillus chiayiensis]
MSETELPKRQAVDPKLTWDLTPIFHDDFAYAEAIKQVRALTKDFVRMYQGKLTEPAIIVDALADYGTIVALDSKIAHWGFMPYSTDTTDPKLRERQAQVTALGGEIGGQLSFFQAELTQLSETVLDAVVEKAPDYAGFIRQIKVAKKGALPPVAEKVLAELSPVFQAPSNIRDQTIFGDMDFGTFTAHGKTYPLSFVMYEENYQKHPDTEIRRAAYAQFNKTLRRYENTMATGYLAQVTREKITATMRGYDSVIDYLLADQEINREMFNRQIDVIMRDLAPIMRKYVIHVKTLWRLDHIGYTDLQIDIDPRYAPKITLDQAQDMIKNATALMGKDYQDQMIQAFTDRWIDFPANQGKDSGAYTAGPYGVHPYVEMTWSNTLPAVYTLIHELGHTAQMVRSEKAHNVLDSEFNDYLVESPSTFNELLLTHYLEETAKDPRMKRFALSRLLNDTYFHNFVTHLLEAAFQREVYTLIDKGESFDAARLDAITRKVLTDFWGPAVELEEGADLTWMRQSHYYMGLYSYSYSAGLTVATQAFQAIEQQGKPAVDRWLRYLGLGDSLDPVAAARVAGVDVTTDVALKHAISFLGDTVDEVIALSKEIDQG